MKHVFMALLIVLAFFWGFLVGSDEKTNRLMMNHSAAWWDGYDRCMRLVKEEVYP